jgi:protein-L-isoaspartate(D-aspartate) O-methyltransferase
MAFLDDSPFDFAELRRRMVERQIARRGVRSPLVLDAMGKVAREGYVPSYLGEFAYDDVALPIEEEQTISQPYIVAFMLDALELQGSERVLEIGTGSGYAAAVLGEIAAEVYTIERHESLAREAARRLARDGYHHVRVRHGDGTLGWPDAAPFDAIVVAAGGPRVPEALREQLAPGGRLVIPVGEVVGLQELVRVVRLESGGYREERLGAVRFVPLIGAGGWREQKPEPTPPAARSAAALVEAACEPFASLEEADLGPLLTRIGEARVVLLGEATHGTSEFYRMRARITQELVRQKGFARIALEADWTDAARIDRAVRGGDGARDDWRAASRFPAWMWRNEETRAFVDWLREENRGREPARRVGLVGLDLYGLHESIDAVIGHLERVDPESAALARQRYGCLTPWQSDPAEYGRSASTGAYRSCEADVVAMLRELLARNLARARADEASFAAVENARVVADAEAYYRAMYRGSAESWNLRDRHMFDTLRSLLAFHGPRSKVVVWAHNSHVGDASATEMAARGELNVGELCREEFGPACFALGFGTHEGTVAAAKHWGGPLEIQRVRPSHARSYERVCHETGVPSFFLPLRAPRESELRGALEEARLERAIGVVYRPETELASHYFHAVLPRQFDEYVWFDRTEAVRPHATRAGATASAHG